MDGLALRRPNWRRRLRNTLLFKTSLEQREVFPLRPSDHERHQRREPSGESARRAPVSKRHPRAAVHLLPGVCRFHEERWARRPHGQMPAGYELDDLVGVRQPPSQELRDEVDLRPDLHRAGRLPLDRLDIHVPQGRIVWIGGVLRHVSYGAVDDKGIHDINMHSFLPRERAVLRFPGGAGSPRWPDSLEIAALGIDQAGRRGCCATTGVFAFARALRISTTPTTRNQINGGKFAMMAGPQPPAL